MEKMKQDDMHVYLYTLPIDDTGAQGLTAEFALVNL